MYPKVSNKDPISIFNKGRMLLVKGLKSEETEISFGTFALTRAGIELYSILDVLFNEKYICDLANEIEKRNTGKVYITVQSVDNVDENGIEYDDTVLFSYPSK